jgi:Mg-chelatase subunit ChlD
MSLMRSLVVVFRVCLLLAVAAGPAVAQRGDLQVEIQNIPEQLFLTRDEREIDVAGRASIFGGMKQLDLFLILDASNSLWRTDPKDHRVQAAEALIRALPASSDMRVGVIAFDTDAFMIAPLSEDREVVLEELPGLRRDGGTNLHDGIRMALESFAEAGRPEAAHIALLFTDGKSDKKKAILAAEEARSRGAVIHSVLLLDRDKSENLLRTIAGTTGGSFVYVDDPEELPRAFLDLRTTGVEHVKLSVDGGALIDTDLVAGSFRGNVPLRPGHNDIDAIATDLDGATAADRVRVTVTGPLRVAIASPIDGARFMERESETEVRIRASIFSEPTEALRRSFPQLGVESVVLHVRDSPPIPTTLEGDSFKAVVPLTLHANRIMATATSIDGRTGETWVDVDVRPPGCSELTVSAVRDGRAAISLDDRGVEVIFDASGSMWGRMNGRPKITIAKETVREAMTGFPADIHTALRVYGHRSPREEKNCEDTELLIPLRTDQADRIRQAIEGFTPRGQTPLGYSIEQVPSDFGDYAGERAVVVITDGIESCDGDAVAAAQAFQEPGRNRPIHVIGFGIEAGHEEAMPSLRLIAETTGGKILRAGNGAELRHALAATAGTTFSIWRGKQHVGSGTLGANERFPLEAGDYTLRLHSDPLREFPLTVGVQESLALTLVREGERYFSRDARRAATYFDCAPEGQ